MAFQSQKWPFRINFYLAELTGYLVAPLAAATVQVAELGGTISRDIFSFPGGRRFHFTDPNGNEFAIWSDK